MPYLDLTFKDSGTDCPNKIIGQVKDCFDISKGQCTIDTRDDCTIIAEIDILLEHTESLEKTHESDNYNAEGYLTADVTCKNLVFSIPWAHI